MQTEGHRMPNLQEKRDRETTETEGVGGSEKQTAKVKRNEKKKKKQTKKHLNLRATLARMTKAK